MSRGRSYQRQLIQLIPRLMQICGSHRLAMDKINRGVFPAANHFLFALVGFFWDYEWAPGAKVGVVDGKERMLAGVKDPTNLSFEFSLTKESA